MQVTDPSGRPLQTRGLIRFAVFEVDLRSGEVRKNGLKVRLTGQPFQVLTMLLERPGEVVAREELQKRLWPADTFVDFDHSLNTAINKIREALGDSAESPRFVETLPRRGYRFIAPVDIGAGLVPAQTGHPQGVPPRRSEEVFRGTPPRGRWPFRLAAMLAMLVVGAAVAWYALERPRPKPEPMERQLTANSSELAVRASAISPDGRYLAYADDSGTHLKVINTAETHALPTPADSTINKLTWFPEGDKLLASVAEARRPSVPSLWSVSLLGGAPQKLRDDASDGNVFQDGAGIVFVSDNGKEIWQMGPEGENAQKLMSAPEGESFAMPVVAKGRLWYEGSGGFEFELESRDLKGGPSTILASGLDWTSAYLLLPNGRLIYSGLDRSSLYRGGSLWEIQADLRTGLPRGEPRRIAHWPDFEISGLSRTADGKRLAFVKAHTNRYSVYVGDLEANGLRIVNPHRLTLSDSLDHVYAWTPDSKSVLFDSNRNGTWDIFRQALDQRTPERLVASPGGSIRPAMTADGMSVVYLTPSQPVRIMRLALTGGPPQFLGDIPRSGEIRCARRANLCVVSASDPKQRVLYALDAAKGKGRELLRIDPALHPEEDADWDVSPDGSSLAFIKGDARQRAFQIEVRPLAGGAGRELNISEWGNGGGYMLRWAVDGKGWYVSVWYSSINSWRLLKVDFTGKARQLLQGTTWADAVPSPDGRHVAVMGQILASNVWMLEKF